MDTLKQTEIDDGKEPGLNDGKEDGKMSARGRPRYSEDRGYHTTLVTQPSAPSGRENIRPNTEHTIQRVL